MVKFKKRAGLTEEAPRLPLKNSFKLHVFFTWFEHRSHGAGASGPSPWLGRDSLTKELWISISEMSIEVI